LDLARADHGDALQIAEALREVRLLGERDEHRRRLGAPRLDEDARLLGGRRIELRSVDDGERPLLRMRSERGAQRGLLRLPVHLLHERARGLRERVTAAGELRRADRALAGAAGALLAPRLRAAAGDEPAALRRGRSGTLRVLLGANRLVHEVRLHLGRKHGLVERDILRLLAVASEKRCVDSHQPRTSTMPFFGPGTAPLMRSRLRSASTSCTVSPSWVTRLPPMRPAILIPLRTRDGVADAPIEPGLRMLCEPCDLGPEPKLWRLIVPWKPLPIPRPETLILSPGSKIATVTASPSTAPSIPPRNSTSLRWAPTLNFARWPSSPFESLRSATASNASCTASYPSGSVNFTCTTGHGPASITVTGVTPPVSGSKTCVMPSFLPRMPFGTTQPSRARS